MAARGLPDYFPMDNTRFAINYQFVKIGGESYLLPAHSETMSCARNSRGCVKNKSVFQDYKKFGTRTNITFDNSAK